MDLMNFPVIFLGPSCQRPRAVQVLHGIYRPPARRGDLAQAVRDGAKTLVLIDGYLVYDYPPSPMEVYEVIQQGVKVVGSASLGALRAVELRYHGMIGVGWVYQRYLDGTIVADDEVVTTINPRTGAASSVPLVNIRFGIETLSDIGVMPERQGKELIKRFKDIYFEDRTEASLYEAAESCGIDRDIVGQLLSRKFDIKALDTLSCLRGVLTGKMT